MSYFIGYKLTFITSTQRDVQCRVWKTSWNLHWHQILFVYRKNKIVPLDQWFSKSGPWDTSISSTWERVRPHSRPTEPDALQARPCNQFLKPSWWYSWRWKLENQCFQLSLQITDLFCFLAERREKGKYGKEREEGQERKSERWVNKTWAIWMGSLFTKVWPWIAAWGSFKIWEYYSRALETAWERKIFIPDHSEWTGHREWPKCCCIVKSVWQWGVYSVNKEWGKAPVVLRVDSQKILSKCSLTWQRLNLRGLDWVSPARLDLEKVGGFTEPGLQGKAGGGHRASAVSPPPAFCDPAWLTGKSLRLHSVQGHPLLLVCDVNKSRTL